jgi:hypothetical protein
MIVAGMLTTTVISTVVAGENLTLGSTVWLPAEILTGIEAPLPMGASAAILKSP